MPKDVIKIRRARVHNLKNISLDIPKNKLVVITGISGSGKSSLVFDTIYAEGQRRYVESLSSYARQFLETMPKPDVDSITGISPAISIDQRRAMHNPRSTVGTITEIYDYLRLLFSRIGKPHCPKCGKLISKQTVDQMVSQIIKNKSLQNKEVMILGPLVRGKKGEHYGVLEQAQRKGFLRVRIDGVVHRTEEAMDLKIDRQKRHNIEAVVDRLVIDADADRSRLLDSVETALKIGKGLMAVSPNYGLKVKPKDLVFSELFACQQCGTSLPELEPRLFSFNSPYGACSSCQGLGERLEIDPEMIMVNDSLSIAEGVFFPWIQASYLQPGSIHSLNNNSSKTGPQKQLGLDIFNVSKKHKFSLNEPVKNLSPQALEIILYGEKDNDFEGLIPFLEKRYRETESDYLRSEIGKYMIKKECEACSGKRLNPEVLAVTVAGKSIDQMVAFSVAGLIDFFQSRMKLEKGEISETDLKVVRPIIKEIINRSQFLVDVGLDYLTLDRRADSLAGGEEQRIRLATQIGSKLSGVLYILDEPSVGLHLKDQVKLINTLKRLRDLGNTVLVVEHDAETIRHADWVIDIGPGAGRNGGQVMFEGTPKQLFRSQTSTGQYLSGKKRVEAAKIHAEDSKKKTLLIKGAQEHNLKNIDVEFPLGRLVCISGVSGSGKSSLMNDILAKALLKKFYNAKTEPGKHQAIKGTEHINKVVLVDQSPIGRTPRSNPATYTSAFSYIRKIFSETKEARAKNFQSGQFSFNVKGGRCPTCQGQGQIKVEMYFLPDVYIQCQDCKGKRFNKETLTIEYKGKNIAEVLEMTVEESLKFFRNVPGLYRKLKILQRVGLDYLQLGQPAPSLSGGEAQRVKLATELSKKGTGSTLYILDEPTTGLHPEDIQKLLFVLRKLVEKGNTVLVIEHNLDIIGNADWVIDLGPEGGEKGGYIVAQGTPDKISKAKKSYTGQYLKRILSDS